jgi:hypothetical protein
MRTSSANELEEKVGSGISSEGAGAASGVVASGIAAPSRVSPSCAFVFQSARRKRCAATVYQRIASAELPARSSTPANSNAAMASRVRSKSFASCTAGSVLVLALRMRAWICRQSLTDKHSSSQTRKTVALRKM